MLDDDDVTGIGRFDRGGAEVMLGRAAIGGLELHGADTAGDALPRRARSDAGDGARQAEPIERVRDGTGIEAAETIDGELADGSDRCGGPVSGRTKCATHNAIRHTTMAMPI